MSTRPGGLRGDYSSACVVCMRGTDTALVLAGEAEWIVAGLINLGVPPELAPGTLSTATGCDPGMVPDGRPSVIIRICSSCAQAQRLQVGLLATGQPLPEYGQRSEPS